MSKCLVFPLSTIDEIRFHFFVVYPLKKQANL